MNLIFFDLDGTLLNDVSEISPYTRETLQLLSEKDIAYTVATGRNMLSAKNILKGHEFKLPQIYNNGVTIWDPQKQQLTHENLLNNTEISSIIAVAARQNIAPFIHAVEDHHHFIFHGAPQHDVEKKLLHEHYSKTDATLLPLASLPKDSSVTNISMIGFDEPILDMWQEINANENLVAYSGPALEGKDFHWMDVHHRQASKGSAVTLLKEQLQATNIICFGDSDNDLSMFALADECYAPENARAEIKKSANAVIGHNHEDGIARFLRERFSL